MDKEDHAFPRRSRSVVGNATDSRSGADAGRVSRIKWRAVQPGMARVETMLLHLERGNMGGCGRRIAFGLMLVVSSSCFAQTQSTKIDPQLIGTWHSSKIVARPTRTVRTLLMKLRSAKTKRGPSNGCSTETWKSPISAPGRSRQMRRTRSILMIATSIRTAIATRSYIAFLAKL